MHSQATATIPPPPNTVASYEATLTATGAPVIINSTTGTFDFNAAPNTSIVGTCVEIDALGSRSVPSDPVTFVVPTDIAPPQPGPLTFHAVSVVDLAGAPTVA
jgi:hypothetical protein